MAPERAPHVPHARDIPLQNAVAALIRISELTPWTFAIPRTTLSAQNKPDVYDSSADFQTSGIAAPLFPLHAPLKNIAMANALLHRRLNARQRG